MPEGVRYVLYKPKGTSSKGVVFQAANVCGGDKAGFITSQGGHAQEVTSEWGSHSASQDRDLPLVPLSKGKYDKEQKLRLCRTEMLFWSEILMQERRHRASLRNPPQLL